MRDEIIIKRKKNHSASIKLLKIDKKVKKPNEGKFKRKFLILASKIVLY